jgi:hypothetical protein
MRAAVIQTVTSVLGWDLARKSQVVKTVDEEAEISCLVGRGKLREEVWQDSASGCIVRYNLAFVNHLMYRGDNTRVLGYDVAHGYHHRHFMGETEDINFPGYEELSKRFFREVAALRKKGSI